MASSSSQPQPKTGFSNSISSASVVNKAVEKDLSWYLPLCKAAIKGDWEGAKRFLELDRGAVTARITKALDTALLVAATERSIYFMEQLVELMQPEELALANRGGDTAFHLIAGVGNIEAAKLLHKKNSNLPNLWNEVGQLPLRFAAMVGHKDMILYLLNITKEDMEPKPFEDQSGSLLMSSVITSGLLGVPLMLEKFPNIPGGDVESPAECSQSCAEACRWFPMFRGNQFISVCLRLHAGFWEVVDVLVPQIKHVQDTKLMHHHALQLVKCFCTKIISLDNKKSSSTLREPFLFGAQLGIHEVIEEILEVSPAAISFGDRENHTTLHLAVINCHENVFNLISQMGEYKQFLSMFTNKFENNILHLAGELAPKQRLNLTSGAALQMQRELHWFKEVEKFVLPPHKEHKNNKGKTPAMVFTEAHNSLVKEEKWMKNIEKSCTVAATLIATVVFKATITVPGGNNGEYGFPIFSKQKGFIVFAISNAISLFSSLSSGLMFLSILTSRCAEADFLYALLKRLIIGIVTLFLSITSMMVAFGTTLYLVFGHKKAWVLIPVAGMACLPITLFVSLQFPLLVDMISSTYGPGIFRKQSERILL